LTAASLDDSPVLRELIEQCRERPYRDDAWERFFNRYDHLIRLYVNTVARTTPSQDREDIRQKIWLRMPKILERFDPNKGSLPALLKTVCNRAVHTEYRRFQRERQFETPADQTLLELVRQSPEEQDSNWIRVFIKNYLKRKVNDSAKLAVYIDWIEGFHPRDVMARHRISRAVAYRRFEECRLLAKKALQGEKK
jgi:DNA-directed RNA polymerase specialized sigma24 family protein